MNFGYMLARKWAAWAIPLLLLVVTGYYWVRAPHVWVPSDSGEPLVALRVPHGQRSLVLQLDGEVKAETRFNIAATPAAGRRWLQFAMGAGSAGLAACDGEERTELKLTWPHQEPQCSETWALDCARTGDKITLTLVPKDRPQPVVAGAGAPAACGVGRSRWNTLYLVPYVAKGGIVQPAGTRWKRIDDVEGEACLEDADCGVSWMAPGLTLTRANDPQHLVKTFVEAFVRYFAPGSIMTMMLVDGLLALLLGLLLGCFAWTRPWLSGIYLRLRRGTWANRKSADSPAFFLVSEASQGLRALLDFLSVAGPALGFFLTVVALLLAMRPEVFGAGVTAFTQQLSLALTSTLLGLGMRLLADASGRLVEYQLQLEGEGRSLLRVEDE